MWLAWLVLLWQPALASHDQVLSPRIVGGVKASLGEFPAQIALKYHGSQYCGGTLIHESFVLTAAHCFYRSGSHNVFAPQLTVHYGAVDLRAASGQGTVVGVDAVIISPLYNDRTTENDIALLKLKQPAVLSTATALGLVSSDVDPPVDKDVIMTGFGSTNKYGNGVSPDMYKVHSKVRDNPTCDHNYGGHVVYPSMICAGIPGVAGRDSCVGDSGGPVWVETPAGYAVLGLSSFGGSSTIACGDPTHWAVNTRVALFVEWIAETLALHGASASFASLDGTSVTTVSSSGTTTTATGNETAETTSEAETTASATTTGGATTTETSMGGSTTKTDSEVLQTMSDTLVVTLLASVEQFSAQFFAVKIADVLGIHVNQVSLSTARKGGDGVMRVDVQFHDTTSFSGQAVAEKLLMYKGAIGEWAVHDIHWKEDESTAKEHTVALVKTDLYTIIVSVVGVGLVFLSTLSCLAYLWSRNKREERMPRQGKRTAGAPMRAVVVEPSYDSSEGNPEDLLEDQVETPASQEEEEEEEGNQTLDGMTMDDLLESPPPSPTAGRSPAGTQAPPKDGAGDSARLVA